MEVTWNWAWVFVAVALGAGGVSIALRRRATWVESRTRVLLDEVTLRELLSRTTQ